MRAASSLLASLALLSGAWGRVKYVGVAIPGIDFGCDIDGSCPVDTAVPPLTELGGKDGAGQMKHFVEDSGLNTFRLSSTWQWLVNEQEGGKLDPDKFEKWDMIMQACLDTGAYCMIDVHNFARYDGGIIGQGGPSNEVFAQLWSEIAHKYADQERVIFGLMNEPHDLDIELWAETCQKAVTAIRKAGAKSQIILLPGTNFASAETFVSTGSADLLGAITNPDGSKDGLILDLHKYLDINNSGTHEECTTDNVEGFKTIATWLRKNKREAIISETGASMHPTCMEKFCTQNEFIAKNSDVFIGFVGWGAGGFEYDYVLTLTPLETDDGYEDNKLMKQCILKPFIEDAGPATTSTSTKASKTKTAETTILSKATSTESSDAESTASEEAAEATQQIFKEGADSSSSRQAASNDDDDSGSARSVEFFAAGLISLLVLAVFHF
ncbi:hypothetical protein ACJZ2D_000864 [Fusarium nematophilum]